MFDIGNIELFIIFLVLIIFIKPKDLPIVLRKFGIFISKLRNISYILYKKYDDWIKLVEMEEEEKNTPKPKKKKAKSKKKRVVKNEQK